MTSTGNSVASKTPTNVAIDNLKNYLYFIGHTDVTIYIKDDMVYVEFPRKITFSSDQLDEVKDIFYWTKTLNIPYIDGLVHFYEYSDSLLISVKFYDKICKVRELLLSKDITVLEFDVCNYEFSFKVNTSNQEDFNEDFLSEIKRIVDPEDIFRRAVGLFKVSNNSSCYNLSMKG